MKENVLEAITDLGFKLNNEEGMGYIFDYEGMHLLYMYNESDEDFLSIAIPGIIEVAKHEPMQISALLEKVNYTLKYVKAYVIGSTVWLFYERELFGGEDLPSLISRMIYHLEAAYAFSRNAMAEIEQREVGNPYSGDDANEGSQEISAEEKSDDDNE